MDEQTRPSRIRLEPGGTVVVIGGGPGGAFFAIHLLRKAKELKQDIKVIIIERRRPACVRPSNCLSDDWRGCSGCAGGISPQLNDVLQGLNLKLPAEVVQNRIHSITIQGNWKNIELEVPPGREVLTVYRGSRPAKRGDRQHNFDSFLLGEAHKAGAELISGEVSEVRLCANGKPLISYRTGATEAELEADLAVFASGVKEVSGTPCASPVLNSLRQLIPGFVPPRLRRALVFELEGDPFLPASLAHTIHFVEYGSRTLRLEMCSLVPKRDFVTVVLVGASVDEAAGREKNREFMRQFLELPHIRKLISPGVRLHAVCVCNPNLVVGSARRPFRDRIAAVGDISTARLYKDGILSAHQTAWALAQTVLTLGIDAHSLDQGYGPTLRAFRRDNRFASIVFLLHRIFFGSAVLSRILYQAVITERKKTPSTRRRLEKLLWQISSGDNQYRDIFRSMIHPATIGAILTGGLLLTLRNYLTELILGLRWEGIGGFTTGVAKEQLEANRSAYSSLIAEFKVLGRATLEFERMYTIKIQTPPARILDQLRRFGEEDRGYLKPRWLRVQRIAGQPHVPGCVIRYEVFGGSFSFNLILERIAGQHLVVYRVRDGFAQGGILVFEIVKGAEENCALTLYVTFNFARGRGWVTRPFWWLFRQLFPAFVHDVIWNHSLCKLKNIVETDQENRARPPGASPCI